MSQAERDRLEKLAQAIVDLADREREMQKTRTFLPSIPYATGEWFVAAVRSYLDGEEPLEQALGLVRRPGNPGRGDGLETALLIDKMRDQGKTWDAIAAELERDKRDVQRIHQRYESQINQHWAEIASARFKDHDKNS